MNYVQCLENFFSFFHIFTILQKEHLQKVYILQGRSASLFNADQVAAVIEIAVGDTVYHLFHSQPFCIVRIQESRVNGGTRWHLA